MYTGTWFAPRFRRHASCRRHVLPVRQGSLQSTVAGDGRMRQVTLTRASSTACSVPVVKKKGTIQKALFRFFLSQIFPCLSTFLSALAFPDSPLSRLLRRQVQSNTVQPTHATPRPKHSYAAAVPRLTYKRKERLHKYFQSKQTHVAPDGSWGIPS